MNTRIVRDTQASSGKADLMREFLQPGQFIDSDASNVVEFAKRHAGESGGDVERMLKLYHAVRDGIVYDPYVDLADPDNYRASAVLARGRAFCVGKAAVLAASARAIGVPARVGYADVKNHLTSPRFYEHIKTDIFIWHSYADLYLNGRWVKATPAFDRVLCDKLGLKTLEFDASEDSLLQPFDRSGRRHMEYLKDRGPFPDVPFAAIQADFNQAYPNLMKAHGLAGEFRDEAVAAQDA
jgi:transglutaminase-like putative cysteine protease